MQFHNHFDLIVINLGDFTGVVCEGSVNNANSVTNFHIYAVFAFTDRNTVQSTSLLTSEHSEAHCNDSVSWAQNKKYK